MNIKIPLHLQIHVTMFVVVNLGVIKLIVKFFSSSIPQHIFITLLTLELLQFDGNLSSYQ